MSGVSETFIRIPAGLLEDDDSMVASPSVVSVPLSSCIEESSPSDCASSAGARKENKVNIMDRRQNNR